MPSPNGAKFFLFPPSQRYVSHLRNVIPRFFGADAPDLRPGILLFTIKIARSKNSFLRIRYLNDFFCVRHAPCQIPPFVLLLGIFFDIAFQTMQIDWINLLVFRLFHLFNKYTNSNLPLPRLFSGKACGKGGKEHIFSDK